MTVLFTQFMMHSPDEVFRALYHLFVRINVVKKSHSLCSTLNHKPSTAVGNNNALSNTTGTWKIYKKIHNNSDSANICVLCKAVI